MSIREFRDDDHGYQAWLATHTDGFVINILPSRNTKTARVHRAHCRTIRGQNPHGGAWTKPYVKVCSQSLAELVQWTNNHVGKPIPSCGTCHPALEVAQPISTNMAQRAPIAAPLTHCSSTVHGPDGVNATVRAWADDYIRFERLPDWQTRLRAEIKTHCGHLEPSVEQVLHATFFGPKHRRADIENLLLYYIDSFRVAGRNGIRFEHGAAVPATPDGAEYPFCYGYALAPRTGAFTHWRQGRALASFGWTDLGAFAGEKKLAQVWLALSRGEVAVFAPAAPETPFAVKVQVRPPRGVEPVWGGLVKGIFDGVICALQAHIDVSVLPHVLARLATVLPADAAELEGLLLDQRRAVLGAVHRLVSPYRKHVKWDPSDHLCVAGELLAIEPVDSRWAIRGELVELSR